MPAPGAGNIELPGSVDMYTFTGAAGQKVFVDQLTASSCSLTWSLTGPGRRHRARLPRASARDPGQITLGAAGTYTLKVLATGSTTGTYSFRITNVAPPQSFAYTVGATVVNGTPAAGAGNIEAPGSVDTYTFTAVAGQKVFVDQLHRVELLADVVADRPERRHRVRHPGHLRRPGPVHPGGAPARTR